jgi:hypothetical protein
MVEMSSSSLEFGAGHVVTPKDHHCGDFKDQFDWSSLTPAYRRQIGDPNAPRRR